MCDIYQNSLCKGHTHYPSLRHHFKASVIYEYEGPISKFTLLRIISQQGK